MAKQISLGALLAVFFLLISGSAPVRAHARHDHASTKVIAVHLPVLIPAAIEPTAAEDRAGAHAADGERPTPGHAGIDLTTTSDKIPEPLHSDSCCCGSLACHAGVSTPVMDVSHQYRSGERMRPASVLGVEKSMQNGIERPPRGPFLV